MPDNTMMFVWLALTVVFTVIEVATAQLTTVWFALGSLVTMIITLCGVKSIAIQVTIFILVSVLALAATRPMVKKLINKKAQPTNADRCIGKIAVVTEEIDNLHGKGAVSLNGVVWTARSNSGNTISEGQNVKVLRIEGVKLIVESN